MRKLLVPLALLALAAPAQAQDREERTIDRSRHLWATINICDSRQSPDTVGIRASMPGSGRDKERMFMRFRVQLKTPEGTWRDLAAKQTRSKYVPVGAARFKARQSGWSFPFTLRAGQKYELRGVVNYQWRRGDKVVRRAVKATRSGHRTALSEPRNYSAATCVLEG